MSLQVLREKRDEFKKQLRAINEGVEQRKKEGKTGLEAFPAEERAKFDAIKPQLLSLNEEIEVEERAADMSAFLMDAEEKRASQKNNPKLTDEIPFAQGQEFGQRFNDRDEARHFAKLEEKRSRALSAWARSGFNDHLISGDDRGAAKELGVNIESRSLSFNGWGHDKTTEARSALAAGTNRESTIAKLRDRFAGAEKRGIAYDQTSKDSFIPVSFSDTFELAFHGMGGIMDLVDLLVTDFSDSLMYPFADDYGNEGARVGAGNASALDAQTVKSPKLQVIEFHSKYLKIHKSLLANSPALFVSMLAAVAGERLRKAMERELVSGPAATADRFRGIAAAVPTGLTQAVAGTYTYAETRKLKMSVIQDHRVNGSYVVNNEQLILLDALLDTTGRPLFDADSGMLCGSPYRVSNYVQAQTGSATGNLMLYFGNWKAVKMRIMSTTRLEKFVELFGDTHEAAFIAYRGGDAELVRGTNVANSPIKAMARP